MDQKKPLTDERLEYLANLSDNEFDDIYGSYDTDSSNYIPSSESDNDEDEENQNEVDETSDSEPEDDSPTSSGGNSDTDLWVDIEEDPEQFLFQENPGLKINYTQLTMQETVNMFLTDNFLQLLVDQTNLYAKQEIEKRGKIKKSQRASKWVDVDVQEIKIFFALLLQMGPCNFPSIEHYWSTDSLYNIQFWRLHMSRNRFQLLLRYIHFTDNTVDSTDRLFKIRPILSHFNNIMKQNYVPNIDICIDESMMLWRGRLSFRQYIKNKKHKYGIKLYELCESNGIVMKIHVYSGKTDEITTYLGHTTDVVMHLLEGYLDKGYKLYMDNFYNSVSLTKLLTAHKTYICGTLRNNRKGNPQVVVSSKLKKGEYIWRRNGPVIVCKWKDKREVLSISNMHSFEMVETKSRSGKTAMKPNIISDYNKGMSGIDRSDQMLSYYSSLRKTIRWPKKVALHIIEIFIHNAHKLFQKVNNSKIKLIKFREDFVKTLLGKDFRTAPAPKRSAEQHYLEALPPTEKKLRPTKPCRICTGKSKRKETRYFCPKCEVKPALCIENCFKIFHNQ